MNNMLFRDDGHLNENVILHRGHLSYTISIGPKMYVDNLATVTTYTCAHLSLFYYIMLSCQFIQMGYIG